MDPNKFNFYKWSFGDRYDGWRVRKVDTVFRIIPYFLRTRIDSQNFFEEKLPIDGIEAFIKQHKEDIPDLSIMHIIIAALVRLISQRPNLNRFVIWNKIFARNHLNISIAVKKTGRMWWPLLSANYPIFYCALRFFLCYPWTRWG